MKVLLTGASRGIGRAVAEALVARGEQLALAVRDSTSVAQLVAAGQGSLTLPMDLRDRSFRATLVPSAIAALGGLDALINCAGIVEYLAVAELREDSLREQFEVNFFAAAELSQQAALHMQANGGGVIINVASTLGLRTAPLTAAYSASKAALISWTRSLAIEFGRAGVRVNAIAPGVIDTDMVRGARKPEELAQLAGLHALGRLGTAEEVAHAVLYLLDATFVTGSVLVVDGGLVGW